MRVLLYWAITLALVVGAIEGAARLTYRIVYGRSYDPRGIAELAQDSTYLSTQQQEIDYLSYLSIHPYLGFVGGGDPNAEAAHGFYGGFPPATSNPPGAIVVLLTGGSVALQTGPVLEATLGRRLGERAGREVPVRLFVAAHGGFKQPQQLMALNYLWLVGLRFDLVINLDGYNEIALPWAENVPLGIHPIFPRRWDYRINKIQSHDELERAGEIVLMKRRKQSILRWREEHVASRSAVVGLVLGQIFVSADRRINELTHPVADGAGTLSFEATGPRFEPKEREAVLDFSTSVWKESSWAMDRFARSIDVPYLHVLQPNQYLEGSKMLSPKELAEFYVPTTPQADAVREGYPHMIEAGRALAAQGVTFRDATASFAKEPLTTYIDACCHMNELGLQMLTDIVAEEAVGLLGPVLEKRASGEHH